MRLVLAIAFLAVLGSCDRSIDDIEEQRRVWTANRPQAYAYTIQVSGSVSSRELLHPKRVRVSDGSVSGEYVWPSAEHEVGAAAAADTYWRIERVFDELIRAKRKNAAVRARFDERFGFVERAYVDYGAGSTGWDVEIRDFEDRALGR